MAIDPSRGSRRAAPADRPVTDDRLAARARMHAALGDPLRLAMVDALVLGDASPGELGALTGLPTNLLAHHLGVLDQAGLVRRVRSEGDRRRSYVQLRWEDPLVAALAPPGGGVRRPPRVVFVCTANSARSQLAAAAWAAVSALPVASAGTRPAERVHPRAVRTARRHGLRLDDARPHHVEDTVRTGDLLVAVCDSAHEDLAGHAPADRPRLHWAVADPVPAGTDDAFEAAWRELTPRVDRLAAALATPAPDRAATT